MNTIILSIETENTDVSLLKKIVHNIKGVVSVKTEKAYNPEFVKMIKERKKNIEKGEFVVLTDQLKKELFDTKK